MCKHVENAGKICEAHKKYSWNGKYRIECARLSSTKSSISSELSKLCIKICSFIQQFLTSVSLFSSINETNRPLVSIYIYIFQAVDGTAINWNSFKYAKSKIVSTFTCLRIRYLMEFSKIFTALTFELCMRIIDRAAERELDII